MLGVLFASLAFSLLAPASATEPHRLNPAQDPLFDKEKYLAACPDYKTYSQYGQ
jgi:hypothetical protein